jgi:hypothetical protein
MMSGTETTTTRVRIVKRKSSVSDEVVLPNDIEPSKKEYPSIVRRTEKTLAETVANHFLFYRNHYWKGCKEAFPHIRNLHHVDKFFPLAEGGPLYIDEKSDKDQRDLKAKEEVMKKLGHRYLIITPNMSLLEALEALA